MAQLNDSNLSSGCALYGEWIRSVSEVSPSESLWSRLSAFLGILSPTGIVVIVSDKRQEFKHGNYVRLEQFQVDKRRVGILRSLVLRIDEILLSP